MLLIYNDVIDHQHCEMLIQEYDTNPNKKVLNAELDSFFDNRVLYLQRMSSEVQNFAAQLVLEVSKLLGRHFQPELVPETVSVVRWSAGEAMAAHRDGQNPHTVNRTHACLIYLNDQEEGGEIYFPELGATICPRRASMVAYPKNTLHGVTPVKFPRYTLTMWFSDNPACSVFQAAG